MRAGRVPRGGERRLRRTGGARMQQGMVVSWLPQGGPPDGHERKTRQAIAAKLAALQGCEFGGEFNPAATYERPLYFVPGESLLTDTASALGIRNEQDLFGGVVPYPFVATKSITHALPAAGVVAPLGWSRAFARAVRGAVVPGYTAFSHADLLRAGERLLAGGRVRIKPALGIGGRGQSVAADRDALALAVHRIDAAALARYGAVVERHLEEVTTYSVGQVRVGALIATYCGTQKLTIDHCGEAVYGGSDLNVARGDFDALLALPGDDAARAAVERARRYDAAATRCFPGFFASRRNYDVVRGRDGDGRIHFGVLEQSWRIGGASGAEVAALEAFRNEPTLRAVRAECTECYDENACVPDGAHVYFRGVDPEVGFLTKYTVVNSYVDA